jgi:hypothetical protein
MLSSRGALPFQEHLDSLMSVGQEFIKCCGVGEERIRREEIDHLLNPTPDAGGLGTLVIPNTVRGRKQKLRDMLAQLCGRFLY